MTLETVVVVQFLGLLIGVPLALGLVGVAHRLRPHLWPYIYLVFLYCASSLQAWRALFYAQWLSGLVLIALVVSCFWGLPHLFRVLRNQYCEICAPEFKIIGFWGKLVLSVLVPALIVELLFAAFPGYRYDQYNYHLVTPKLVDSYGVLPPSFGTDHTHFTGSWEYFFTSFRLILTNDLVVQTATTTFTFLSYLLPMSGLLWQIARPHHLLSLWWVGIPALAIYVHVEIEPVISSKPDFVNVASAMAITAAQGLVARERFFLTCFFLAAGLAFKITWIHAAVALGIALVVINRRDFKASSISASLAGAALGAFCVLPVFVKNTVFFGNPLHPTQLGPLKSVPVTEAFFRYWDNISGRPHGLSDTFFNIIKVPLSQLAYYLPLVPVLMILGYLFMRNKKLDGATAVRALPWVLAWATYLVLWGVLFRFDIYNRFVAIACIFPLLLIAVGLASVRASTRTLAFVFLLPLAINGAMEVKLLRMFKAAGQNYSEYSLAVFSPTLQDFREAKIIHAHAESIIGPQWRDRCHIVAAKVSHYFFNTRFTNFDDYTYDYFVSIFGRERYKECPWAFFREMKFCYAIAHRDQEFAQWPAEIRSFAQAAPINLAGDNNSDLRIRFMHPSELDMLVGASPECSHESRQSENRIPSLVPPDAEKR